ncbi:hypothetical protein XbrCFBP1976_18385 [Xanthomonas bromi]|nr:hypothetical protein XbrCFBP1976_18385 [Xanthomonas bromi]
MERLSRFNFVMEADALLAHEDRLRRILEACVEEAAAQPNPRVALQSVFDRQVDLAAVVTRQDIVRHGPGWKMGPHYYASTGELVETALLPFRAVAQPEAFFSAMPQHPAYLPVVAAPAVQLIAAFLGTHYPRCLDASYRTDCSFNPHFHWGARDMAGYPPVQNGYFARSSRAKIARRTADMLVRRFQDLDPVLFVLIPASIFMLCPTAASEGDSEAVADLIAKVRDRAGALPAEKAMAGVSDVVSRWLATGPSVSPYFLRRFLPRSGVGHGAPLPPPSTLVRPEGFTSFSLRQACMTVAALMEQVPALQAGHHA